ncbi:PhoU family transcriptional regulator [Francisella sp. 19X1-34]|uniref:PhoU family transcriptional regulator n=1 Tax=Francisella sp. 19X1-34 TaxID=3087177 RepID=UPI002E37AE49|nr:PhoU family transcriptional regulator [Francisella sp. 19X1-34]MED7787935.1 PhoU family transcriptional regulator [Francisella sp. 19X1-34]
MLRKLVKTLIPSQDKVFFELMIEATEAVEDSARILDLIVKEKDSLTLSELTEELRLTRTVTVEVANKMDHELARHFVTPVDRVELHNIITLLLKLNKRIVKIHRYMQILMEEERGDVNLYLANCVETLRKMTKVLDDMMKAFTKGEKKDLKSLYIRLTALDENVLEDLAHALKRFSHFEEGDVIFIMKVKDIYKAIENAISTCTSIAESIMRIHVKEV